MLEAVVDPSIRDALARSDQPRPLIIAMSHFLHSIQLEYEDRPNPPPPTTATVQLPARHHNLGLGRAVVLAVWHLPEVLPLISRVLRDESLPMLRDEDRLREVALAALDDEHWPAMASRLQREQDAGTVEPLAPSLRCNGDRTQQ